jgi:hypothetical protein
MCPAPRVVDLGLLLHACACMQGRMLPLLLHWLLPLNNFIQTTSLPAL